MIGPADLGDYVLLPFAFYFPCAVFAAPANVEELGDSMQLERRQWALNRRVQVAKLYARKRSRR